MPRQLIERQRETVRERESESERQLQLLSAVQSILATQKIFSSTENTFCVIVQLALSARVPNPENSHAC